MENPGKLSSGGLGELIREHNSNNEKGLNPKTPTRPPIAEPRKRTLENAIKALPSRLKKLESPETKSVEDWETLIFNIRAKEGLKAMLEEQGAHVEPSEKDGIPMWTITKL